MTESNITPTTITIGIDLGDRKSHICVLDAVGEIAEESRIATTPKALRARFEGLVRTRIALEVGGHSAWVSELLKELGLPVGEGAPSKRASEWEQGPSGCTRPRHRYLWAELMRRVFGVEVLRCGVCHSLRRLIAVITQRHV